MLDSLIQYVYEKRLKARNGNAGVKMSINNAKLDRKSELFLLTDILLVDNTK